MHVAMRNVSKRFVCSTAMLLCQHALFVDLVDHSIKSYTYLNSCIKSLLFDKFNMYAAWKQNMRAFMSKVGVKESAYATPIPRWNDMVTAVRKWEYDRVADAIAAEIDGAVVASPTAAAAASTATRTSRSKSHSPAPAGSSSSSTSSTTSSAASSSGDDISRRKVIRELVESSEKAFGYLYEALTSELRLLVQSLPSGYAYGIWQLMQDKYQNTDVDNVADLYKKWNDLSMIENETFDSYKARVDEIQALLVHAKDKPSPGQYSFTVLNKLQPKFKQAVLALAASNKLKDPAAIDWPAVVVFMNTHERSEQRLTNAENQREEMQMANAVSSGRAWVKNKSSPEVECYNCHEKGHIKPNCPRLAESQNKLVANNSNAASLLRCASCGSTNHSSGDHDDSKVPMWRRNRPNRAAAAAQANAAKGNADASLNRANAGVSEAGDQKSESEFTVPNKTSKSPQRSAHAYVFRVVNRFSPLQKMQSSKSDLEIKNNAQHHAAASSSLQSSARRAFNGVGTTAVNKQKSATAAKKSIAMPVQHMMPKTSAIDLHASLKNHEWGVDTMASVHICGDKSKFVGSLKPCRAVEVKVADGAVVTAKLSGTVVIHAQTVDKSKTLKYLLSGVLYHPNFSLNLISWVKLKKQNWQLHSTESETYLISPARNKIALQTVDDVVVLHGIDDPNDAKVCAISSTSVSSPPIKTAGDLMKAHQRFGHLGVDALIKVLKAAKTDDVGALEMSEADLKIARDEVLNCIPCAQAKGTRTAFGHRGLDRGAVPFEVLHMDTYQVKYVGRNDQIMREYGVVVIDPYSEWVAFIHANHKDKIPGELLKLFRHIANQTGDHLKRLHCDGGTEFINAVLKDWCNRHGVEIHPPPAGTPQLNGIAERHVRILKDTVRTLLIQSSLPMRYWTIATEHYVCLRNRTHIGDATGMTPYEAMYKRKPSLQHFSVFGCDAYYHVPREDRSITMQAKMEPCIYLGYEYNHNSSRIYRLRQRDIIATRDVKLRTDSFIYSRALQQGKVQDVLNGDLDNIDVGDHADERNADDDAVMEVDVTAPAAVQSPMFSRLQGGRLQRVQHDSHVELDAIEEEAASDQNSDLNHSSAAPQWAPNEEQAVQDALAQATLEVACATSSGMHKLEQQTPLTYKQVLLSRRRAD